MSATEPTRRIAARPFGSALKWQVPSSDPEKKPYLVELDSFNGNGECNCEDFNIRHRPKLTRGETARQNAAGVNWTSLGDPRDAFRCKHIIVARRMLLDSQIAAFDQAARAHPAGSRT